MKSASMFFAAAMILVSSVHVRLNHAQTPSNIQITTNTKDQSETAIAINPVNNKHLMVVWNDFKDAVDPDAAKKAKAGYAFSTDGGNTWPIVNVILPYDRDGINYTWGFDPSCAFDRSNNAYYCYVARRTDLTEAFGPIHLAKTNDNGASWDHARVSPSFTYQDKPFMTIDNTGGTYNGRIYVSWADLTTLQEVIKFAVSVDGGSTFPTVVDLGISTGIDNSRVSSEPLVSGAPSVLCGAFVQGPVPAVAPNGDVYVAWLQTEDGRPGFPGTIQVRRGIPSQTSPYISFPNNAVTAANINVLCGLDNPYNQGAYRIWSFPTIAVDQNTGYIYVAYTQLDPNPTGNLNVYYTRSTDNGQSWSLPEKTTDPAFDSYAQFFPWFSIDPTGRLGLLYCDNRNDPDPNVVPPMIDVFYTEYDNVFGFAFAPTIRVTAVTSDANKATFTTDYQGLASTYGFFFPAWNDFRNSTMQNPQNTDAYFARVNRGPTSNSGLATAWGSARKTVYVNSKWHQIFFSNNQVIYAYSTDDGSTWQDYRVISGQVNVSANSNSALATRNNFLYSVFLESGSFNRIYFNRNSSGAWLITPFILTSLGVEITHLSFAIASDGTGHVVWVESAAVLLPGSSTLKHGTFSVDAGTPALSNITTVYTTTTGTITNPALALDSPNNKPHVIWSVSNEIRYSNKTGSNWSSSIKISNTSGVSQYPSVLYNPSTSKLGAVWHNNSTGNNEIWYRERTGSSWGAFQNLSNSSASSTYPFIGGPINSAAVVLWVENVSGNNEIKYTWVGQSDTGLFATTTGSSLYPTFTFRVNGASTRVLGLWTEGSSSPYLVEDGYKDFTPLLPKLVAEKDLPEILPKEFALYQNHPNPFNPTTTIRYALPKSERMSLRIFSLLGQGIRTLVDEQKAAGDYEAVWDGRDNNGRFVSSGVYVYRLEAGNFSDTKKLVLLQ